MKHVLHISFIVVIISMMTSCKKADSSDTGATSDRTLAKGQSTVVDDESAPDILKIALGSEDHTTLVAAVQAADLEDVLTNAGPLTVFAPTNAAFDALPEGTLDELLKPENKAKLAHIITYHAAPGSYYGSNIKGIMGIGQATGDKVKIEVNDAGETTVNGAKILATVKASNGYVHVIDQVLLPPE